MVILRKKQPMGRYEIILNKEGDKEKPRIPSEKPESKTTMVPFK